MAAREQAYCPYSKFKVGASVLCQNGAVFTGCNVENVSYGVSICAERTAAVKAVSAGNKLFKAIVVTAESDRGFVSPCGVCRQFISEFGSEINIYLAKCDLSKVQVTTIKELLPLNLDFLQSKLSQYLE